jgi:hypothetical protein
LWRPRGAAGGELREQRKVAPRVRRGSTPCATRIPARRASWTTGRVLAERRPPSCRSASATVSGQTVSMSATVRPASRGSCPPRVTISVRKGQPDRWLAAIGLDCDEALTADARGHGQTGLGQSARLASLPQRLPSGRHASGSCGSKMRCSVDAGPRSRSAAQRTRPVPSTRRACTTAGNAGLPDRQPDRSSVQCRPARSDGARRSLSRA